MHVCPENKVKHIFVLILKHVVNMHYFSSCQQIWHLCIIVIFLTASQYQLTLRFILIVCVCVSVKQLSLPAMFFLYLSLAHPGGRGEKEGEA